MISGILVVVIVALGLLLWYQRRVLKQVQLETVILKSIYAETCWASWRVLEYLEEHHQELLTEEPIDNLGQMTGYYDIMQDQSVSDEN